MGTKILQAALALHERVSSTFRKTAINFHYEFTVRHLANVFQVRSNDLFRAYDSNYDSNKCLFYLQCFTLS